MASDTVARVAIIPCPGRNCAEFQRVGMVLLHEELQEALLSKVCSKLASENPSTHHLRTLRNTSVDLRPRLCFRRDKDDTERK